MSISNNARKLKQAYDLLQDAIDTIPCKAKTFYCNNACEFHSICNHIVDAQQEISKLYIMRNNIWKIFGLDTEIGLLEA